MDITDRLKTMVADNGLKMTALRQDLLEIFLKTKKPISAYDALDLLKHKRPNAKPPTVYRVIEYFVEKKIIHRVETGNKFVCCTQLSHSDVAHHGILFLCEACGSTQEFVDDAFIPFLTAFCDRRKLQLNTDAPIELKGLCFACRK
jgi:Fur family zinc uptake transcriptional regulator